MRQLLVKIDDFDFFFCLNLGKLHNYMQYFGSNKVIKGVAESWVMPELIWVDLDGSGWRLKLSGWRWIELGEGSCTV